MPETEKLQRHINDLTNRRDDLEKQMRNIKQTLEEEDYEISSSYAKLDQNWTDYREYAPDIVDLLEEERAILDRYKVLFMEDDELLQAEYKKEMHNIDIEMGELYKQMRITDHTEDGEQKHAVL